MHSGHLGGEEERGRREKRRGRRGEERGRRGKERGEGKQIGRCERSKVRSKMDQMKSKSVKPGSQCNAGMREISRV